MHEDLRDLGQVLLVRYHICTLWAFMNKRIKEQVEYTASLMPALAIRSSSSSGEVHRRVL